eukprot:2335899-Alexandrium_andersonii.AAC.1
MTGGRGKSSERSPHEYHKILVKHISRCDAVPNSRAPKDILNWAQFWRDIRSLDQNLSIKKNTLEAAFELLYGSSNASWPRPLSEEHLSDWK